MIRRGASVFLLALTCVLCRELSWAEDSPVAPVLYDDAFLVARVNLERLQTGPLYGLLDRTFRAGAWPSQQSVETVLTTLRRANARELYLVWGGDTGIVFVPMIDDADKRGEEVRPALQHHPLKRWFPVDSTTTMWGGVVAGRDTLLVHLRDLRAAPRPNLAPALAATSDCTLQILIVPTEANRQRVSTFPWPMLQLDATSTAMQRIAWGSIGIDGPPQPRLKLVFEAKDDASVEPLEQALGQAIEPLLRADAVRRNLALVENLRSILIWQRAGKTLSLDIDDREGKLTLVARGMVQPVLEVGLAAGAQMEAMQKLKQIGLAFHNHHDVHKRFPAQAILGADKKPLLSWRVAVLPFIDEVALYKKFHLDEPWDSPHNVHLLAEMPDVYRCPLAKVADDHTVFVVPAGEGAAFGAASGIMIRQIIDGSSKTIATVVVEDENAVPWTRPDDWHYDPDQPTAGLGRQFGERFLCGAFDGSAHAVLLDLDPVVMRALITYSGREPVAFPP